MSYIGPMDKENLEGLRELGDLVQSGYMPEPFGRSYRYLIDTIIDEWAKRGQRAAELESVLAQFADHDDVACVLERPWTDNPWQPWQSEWPKSQPAKFPPAEKRPLFYINPDFGAFVFMTVLLVAFVAWHIVRLLA